jgi:hypothetical protein
MKTYNITHVQTTTTTTLINARSAAEAEAYISYLTQDGDDLTGGVRNCEDDVTAAPYFEVVGWPRKAHADEDFLRSDFFDDEVREANRSGIDDQRHPVAAAERMVELIADHGYHGDVVDFPRIDWVSEVKNGDTDLGYWMWATGQIVAREDDTDQADTDASTSLTD